MIVQGDALRLPLADESVDLIVTSPPYFALRSYRDDGEHYEGQIGSEPTPELFLDALDKSMVEMGRVLKKSGSVFINLGDKYVSTPPGNTRSLANTPEHQQKQKAAYDKVWRMPSGFRQKSLMGLPWRFAIRQIDTGWILRAEIIWSKPNGLPESVTDRVRRSHEQWFHFVKEPRYFSAVDEVREAYIEDGSGATAEDRRGTPAWNENLQDGQRAEGMNVTFAGSPLGRLPGSVWTIPTEPLQVPEQFVDHFAAFPQEWPRKLILGWSPSGICTVCDQGRRPRFSKSAHGEPLKRNRRHIPGYEDPAGEGQRDVRYQREGESCGCPTPDAPTRPAVVLDPFGGTGTVAGVARKLGRIGISLDLSMDYSKLAKWRVYSSGHFDKTLKRTMTDRQGTLL